MKSISEIFRELALHSKAQPSEESLLRMAQRYYSKTFHTPLPQVQSLPLEHLYLHVHEDILSKQDEEETEYEMNKMVDPTFEENEEEDLQNFIKESIKKERAKSSKSLGNDTNPNNNKDLQSSPTQSLKQVSTHSNSRVYDLEDGDESDLHGDDPNGLDDLDEALKDD